MTSRERLLAAFRRQPVDRVPVSTYELVGFNSVSFENRQPSYKALMDAIRAKSDCIAMWNPRSNETFLASSAPLEVDHTESREDNIRTIRKTLHTPKGDLTSEYKVIDDVATVWNTEHWCKSPEDVDRALSIPFEPVSFDASDFPRIQSEVGDHGVIMSSTGDAMCLAADLMEFGEFTVWAMTETEHFARTMQIIHERYVELVKAMLKAQVVDVYRICGPEYATPPYLPPAFFERFVGQLDGDLVDVIHDHGVIARLHSHGRVGQVLESIVKTGADALDPCEGPPDGDIELRDIKKRIGDRVCLLGNVQLKVLEAGTPETVTQTVKECMDQAKDGYGYILMPTAAPINIPLAPQTEANYLAYLDAAERFGAY